MVSIECPACGKSLKLSDRSKGKRVRCGHCKSAIELAADAGTGTDDTQVQSGERSGAGRKLIADSARPQTRVSPKSNRKILKYVAWAALAFIVFIGLYVMLGSQDVDLWEYAREQITREISDPQQRQLVLVIAREQHRSAMKDATGTDFRGRKKLFVSSKEQYLKELLVRVSKLIDEMNTGEKPTEQALADGCWRHLNYDKNSKGIVRLRPDHTYAYAVYPLYGDEAEPDEKHSGRWELRDGSLLWQYGNKDDLNPFVKYSRRAFVIREQDGSLTYWRHDQPNAELMKILK